MVATSTSPEALALARQLFDVSAVSYRADPTDAHFFALSQCKPEPDDRASLTEVAYDVARQCGFTIPVVGHLVKALAVEHRLHEAQHFCERWLDLNPTNRDAQRIAALIACQRMDLPRARTALAALQDAGADLGTVRVIKTAMFLAFTDGTEATITARQALSSSPRDPIACSLAADAAYRTGD